MGVQRITFDGGNVTAKRDADLYHFFLSKEVGILKGLGHECSFTLSNNTITFRDGYVAIYGRILYLEDQTLVVIHPDSTKFGYVLLQVNTLSNQALITSKESSQGYPALTQENLQERDGVYELVLCGYQKTTTSVTLSSQIERDFLESTQTKLANQALMFQNDLMPMSCPLTKLSNGVYRFGNMNPLLLQRSLLYIVIENTLVVSFPGQLLFLQVGSNTSLNYRYGGSDFTLGVGYAAGFVTLTCGTTAHRVTSVYLKK